MRNKLKGKLLLPCLFLVVPVYNESANLVSLFDSLHKLAKDYKKTFRVEIIMVDDGSTDQTATMAKNLAKGINMHLIIHPENMGPGFAFANAFEHLASRLHDLDIIVTLEGDNTSRVDLIQQMLHRLEEGYDVIFASPYLYGGSIKNTSTFRFFLSATANLFVKELLDIHGLQTVSSFFRMYKAKFLLNMQKVYGPQIVCRRGFECMTEMVMKMVYLNARISEIEMILDTAQRVGKSRMKLFQTIVGYFALLKYKKVWRLQAHNT